MKLAWGADAWAGAVACVAPAAGAESTSNAAAAAVAVAAAASPAADPMADSGGFSSLVYVALAVAAVAVARQHPSRASIATDRAVSELKWKSLYETTSELKWESWYETTRVCGVDADAMHFVAFSAARIPTFKRIPLQFAPPLAF